MELKPKSSFTSSAYANINRTFMELKRLVSIDKNMRIVENINRTFMELKLFHKSETGYRVEY